MSGKIKDLSALVDRYEAKILAKPEKEASLQLKLDNKIAKIIAKGNIAKIDGETVTAYTLGEDTGTGGGGTTPTPVGSTFTLTASTPTANYSSLSNKVTVTLDGDNDPVEGTEFVVTLTAQDDTLIVKEFLTASVTGGAGNDTADFSDLDTVTVNLATGVNGGDATGVDLVGFENIIGTDGADTLTGNELANVFTPGDGADVISGLGGDDLVIYENEDDRGTDTINLGTGSNDTVRFTDDNVDLTAAAAMTGVEFIEFTGKDVQLNIGGTALTTQTGVTSYKATGGGTENVIEVTTGASLGQVAALSGFQMIEGTGAVTISSVVLNSGISEIDLGGGSLVLDSRPTTTAGTYDLTKVTLTDVDHFFGTTNTVADTVIINRATFAALLDDFDEAVAVFYDTTGNGAAADTFNRRDTLTVKDYVDFSVLSTATDQMSFGTLDISSAGRVKLAGAQIGDVATVSAGYYLTIKGSATGTDSVVIDANPGGAAAALTDLADVTLTDIENVSVSNATTVTVSKALLDQVKGAFTTDGALTSATDLDLSSYNITADGLVGARYTVSASNIASTDSLGATGTLRLKSAGTYDLSQITDATIVDTAAAPLVFGSSGDDIVKGVSVNGHFYDLGSGNDTYTSGTSSTTATVIGGAGADSITGGSGVDSILGGLDADVLTGGNGADQLAGQAGADSIVLTESVAAVDNVTIHASILATNESSTTSYDRITGFKTATTGDTITFQVDTTNASAVATTAAATTHTAAVAQAAAVDVSAAAGAAAASISAYVQSGKIYLGGTNLALVNSLTEWLAVANTAGVVAAGDAAMFEFNGSTFIFLNNDAGGAAAVANADALVELVGITGATALTGVAGVFSVT